MASSVLTVVFLLVVGLSMLQAEPKKCRTTGKGKLQTFYGTTAYMKMPCKHDLATIKCGDYKVHVAPTEDFDKKNRLYTKSVWVSIRKGVYNWTTRTSTKLVNWHLGKTGQQEQPDLFAEMRDFNMTGAPFQIQTYYDGTDNAAFLNVSDGDLKITFYSYNLKSKNKKNNGIEILCSSQESVGDKVYLTNLCGNDTASKKTLSTLRKNLKLKNKRQVLMHQTLMNKAIVQTKPECRMARDNFLACNSENGARSTAIKICAEALTNTPLIKFLAEDNDDPMDLFVNCLDYMCNNSSKSCDYMKNVLEGSRELLDVSASCLPDS